MPCSTFHFSGFQYWYIENYQVLPCLGVTNSLMRHIETSSIFLITTMTILYKNLVEFGNSPKRYGIHLRFRQLTEYLKTDILKFLDPNIILIQGWGSLTDIQQSGRAVRQVVLWYAKQIREESEEKMSH